MSTRAVPVRDLAPYIGRHVSFTFCDGWEEWHTSGVLVALESPPDYHLAYVYCCDCEGACDSEPMDHGGYGMRPEDHVYVNVGGKQ
jgi:hypothetical protein